MKIKNSRCLTTCLTAFVLIISLSLTVCAQNMTGTPNDVYTHWDTYTGKKTVYSKPMYAVQQVVGNHSLQLEEALENVIDVKIYDNRIYLLSPEQSLISVLNNDYQLEKQMKLADDSGQEIDFSGSKGFYISNNQIFVADTENQRIIVADLDGRMLREITLPSSELIPDDFHFRPIRMVSDNDENLYVLSEGSFYGAIVYSSEYKFTGFYGANTVNASALDVLEKLWDMIFTTNSKRAASERTLPFQFVNLCADENGNIYTVTGSTSAFSNGTGQIKRLSPGGSNILKKKQLDAVITANNFNFLEEEIFTRLNKNQVQDLCSITVDAAGFIYALDSTFGKIYVYDQDCNLLSAFGGGNGDGTQAGTYVKACALTMFGDSLLVLDSAKASLTVYEPTKYGKMVLEAQMLTINGDYDEAAPLWEQVLSLDRNSRLAYRGLARKAYINGNYEDAMEYSRQGLDKTTYDQAYQVVKQRFVKSNFIWIFPVALIALGGLVAFLIISNKKQLVLVKNIKVRTMFSCVLHPFRSFDDIKYKKAGSIWLAVLLSILFYIVSVLRETKVGFLFSEYDVSSFNSIFVLIKTIGLILLFSVANWGLSSLFEGKGWLREVFIVTAYSCLPLVVEGTVYIILSQFMSLSASAFFSAIHIVAVCFTAFMLIVGLMVVHDYNFTKLMGTGILTIVGMILIVFMVFILGILCSQFAEFAVKLYEEVIYR